MSLLPKRRFRRLDRARLEARDVARALPELTLAMRRLSVAHHRYREDGHVRPLTGATQELVDLLCVEFSTAPKRVFMRDRPRPHRRRGGRIVYELHGLCQEDGPLEIYTRTAARAQPVALRTLLNTVLHEWVHHWDFQRFGTSVHCSGFYERLGQLYRPTRDMLTARPERASREAGPA